MVKYTNKLDIVFSSLADPTRRDILERLMHTELSVGAIALPYNVSLADISKHLKVLAEAGLIIKRKAGRNVFVQLARSSFPEVERYIAQYSR